MKNKYQIIYADQPWAFNFQKRAGLSDGAKGRLYPTMKATKAGAGRTATVTKEMIGAAHDVMLAKGDFILSVALLERIYLAMDQAAPLDTCPTCEALARTVMMDQTGSA